MTTPKLRLAFGAVFWRIFLILFAATEFAVWNKIRLMFPGAWKFKRLPWLLYFTPRTAFRAFAIAAVVTIVLDQIVRRVARPLAARWYAPPGAGSDDTPLGFHLEPGESILAESPARRRSGRGWRPGTLILTDRLLWFFPVAWDLEPWSIPVEDIQQITTSPYRPIFGTFVRGVPDRLIVRDVEGRDDSFALAAPSHVLDWFRASGLTAPLPTSPSPTMVEASDA